MPKHADSEDTSASVWEKFFFKILCSVNQSNNMKQIEGWDRCTDKQCHINVSGSHHFERVQFFFFPVHRRKSGAYGADASSFFFFSWLNMETIF